jgi:hypothetical protein
MDTCSAALSRLGNSCPKSGDLWLKKGLLPFVSERDQDFPELGSDDGAPAVDRKRQ